MISPSHARWLIAVVLSAALLASAGAYLIWR